jgi:signal transduction histidine kinase/CheY-like chemotaxis protein
MNPATKGSAYFRHLFELNAHLLPIAVQDEFKDFWDSLSTDEAPRTSVIGGDQRYLLDHMALAIEGVYLLVEGDQILYHTPTQAILSGVLPEDIDSLQSMLAVLLGSDDLSRVSAELQDHVYALGNRMEWEFPLVMPGSEECIWVHINFAPFQMENGLVKVISGMVRDVTRRKQYELQLRESKDRSDELNFELTMINDQLEIAISRANEMALRAETASRSKTEFLANMSHEIRTPLNAIMGMLTILDDTVLNPQQKDFVATIKDGGEALLQIINDILDFSKIEAGRVDLESIPYDLAGLLTEICNMLRFRAEQKDLRLDLDIASDVPPYVIGDPTRVRQVLINLIGNAIKFTETGGITLEIRSLGMKPDGLGLQLNVRDTGIGIPEDRLDRLFKPFSQVDASTTRKFGGTGLGLAISRKLATLMGGEIRIESVFGKGSVFSVSINVKMDHGILEAFREQQNKKKTEKVSLFDPQHVRTELRILLAEDNPVNRKVALLLLSRAGYSADVAENGLRVIQSYDEGKIYDVILMDMQMPEMDGLEATQKLRQTLSRRHQPYIVALTASASKQHRDMCLKAGMDNFLSKPFKVEDLLNILKEVPVRF